MAEDLAIITGNKAEQYSSLIPQIKGLLEGLKWCDVAISAGEARWYIVEAVDSSGNFASCGPAPDRRRKGNGWPSDW